MYEQQLAALMEEHAFLDTRIVEEEKYPFCDTVDVIEMKKQKLHIKDEIARLTTRDEHGTVEKYQGEA